MKSVCDAPVYLGMADVDSCVHRIRIDEDLGQYFCVPTFFTAKELGTEGMTRDGLSLQKGNAVRACCASLPTAFGWSFYFAQRINEQRMSESKALADSVLINADSRVIVFDER